MELVGPLASVHVDLNLELAALLISQAHLILSSGNDIKLRLHLVRAHLVGDLGTARIVHTQNETRRVRVDVDDGCTEQLVSNGLISAIYLHI